LGLKLLGGRPARGTTGHLQSSVCRLQAPAATGAHNKCFQQVQDDIGKARTVCRDWEFVSKGTEISLGKFVSEYFTSLTLDRQAGVISTEDTEEIWKAAKEEAMKEINGREVRRAGADSPMAVEVEDMWRVADKQHVPILTGLGSLAGERGWEIEVVRLVAGQRSVREKEWLEALRIFGIGKEDVQRILGRLDRTLLEEHENLFGNYWRQTFGPSSSMLQLLGKDISVRTSRPPQGD
jgi:hypothetical protein